MRTFPTLALGLILGLLSGCTGVGSKVITLDEGSPRVRAVQVENPRGNVTVVRRAGVGPARVEATLRVDRLQGRARQAELAQALSVTAEMNGGTLVVRADEPADGARVDLRVIVASGSGFFVRSAGGEVALRGIEGRTEVDAEGSVEVVFASPLTEAVTIRTRVGPVVLVLPARSTGAFALTSEKGRSTFTARSGSVTESHLHQANDWTGVLNAGGNLVVVSTDEGDIRVVVER